MTRLGPQAIGHYVTHVAVGASIFAAGRTFDRRHRDAWLATAAVGVWRLHRHHHRSVRRTP